MCDIAKDRARKLGANWTAWHHEEYEKCGTQNGEKPGLWLWVGTRAPLTTWLVVQSKSSPLCPCLWSV